MYFLGGHSSAQTFAMAPFATNVGVLPRHHVNSPPPEQIVGQNKTHISCSGILREVFLRKVFYRFYIHIHVDLRENPWSFEQNSAKMIKYSVGEKNFPMGHNSSSQKKKQIFLICKMLVARRVPPQNTRSS